MSQEAFPVFNELTRFRHGRILYNRNDVYIGRSLELYGEFSPGECQVFAAVVQPGMTIVEVGANIGAHTVFLAQRTGPRGRVFAFEPQRIVFQTLCANLALNQLSNVVALWAAAGAEPGFLKVPELDPRARNNFGGLGLGDFEQGSEVEVRTIDSLGLGACHFLKADVEGMEESVLRGAEATIRQFRPVLYVENDREERAAGLTRYLDSLGYRMFAHHPPLYQPENYRGHTENVFENIVSKNLLCVHRSRPANITGMPEVRPPREGTDSA